MQKEHVSAIDQAEAVVLKKENQFLAQLFVWAEQAQIHALGCGCHQCRGEQVRADAAVLRELERLELIPDAVDKDES